MITHSHGFSVADTSCTEICAGFKFPFPVYPKTFWGCFSSSAVLRYIHDFCREQVPIEDSFFFLSCSCKLFMILCRLTRAVISYVLIIVKLGSTPYAILVSFSQVHGQAN